MRTRFVRILILAAAATTSGFSANILASGNSMWTSPTFVGNLALLGSHNISFVSPGDFAATSLAGFDLVWLDGFSQYLDLSSLTPYLNAGGSVLIQNPGFGSEALSLYPSGAGLGAVFTYPPGEPNVHVLLPGDLVNLGLTDGGLSGWGPSAYGYFATVTAGFLVLTDNGTTGQDITIRLNSGPGTLVYTQQGISQYLQDHQVTAGAPQLQLIDNLLGAPEPGTAALLLLPLAAMLRRRVGAPATQSEPRP